MVVKTVLGSHLGLGVHWGYGGLTHGHVHHPLFPDTEVGHLNRYFITKTRVSRTRAQCPPAVFPLQGSVLQGWIRKSCIKTAVKIENHGDSRLAHHCPGKPMKNPLLAKALLRGFPQRLGLGMLLENRNQNPSHPLSSLKRALSEGKHQQMNRAGVL